LILIPLGFEILVIAGMKKSSLGLCPRPQDFRGILIDINQVPTAYTRWYLSPIPPTKSQLDDPS
jgi:hypothetical protein